MPPTRFAPSHIKNKIKREQITQKTKKAKAQAKLQKRLAQPKLKSMIQLQRRCDALEWSIFQFLYTHLTGKP